MIESNFKKELEVKIDLYINGKLNEEQVDELWVELIQDGYYLDYTKSVANLKAVIEARKNKQRIAPVYKLRKYVNYGAAAAIAIIIGVVSVINYSGTTNTLSIIEAQEQLDLGNIRGGDESPTLTDNEIIKEAIELANNGNVDQAVNLLQNELQSADSPKVIAQMSLTLGSIQYNYGEYNSALTNFDRVVNQEGIEIEILEKGYWYLGNTYLQLDKMAEAELAFQNAYDLDGSYSRISKTYLDALSSRR